MTVCNRNLAVLALIVLIALGAAIALIEPARGQSGGPLGDAQGRPGDGHAENHDWDRTLKTKSGWSCTDFHCGEDQQRAKDSSHTYPARASSA